MLYNTKYKATRNLFQLQSIFQLDVYAPIRRLCIADLSP